MNRRDMFSLLGLGAAALYLPGTLPTVVAKNHSDVKPRRISLNTGTLLGFDLSIEEEIDLTAKVGYDGVEIWMMRLEKYVSAGKKLSDLRKRIEDHGLVLENGIGFTPWIVDDPERREQGMVQLKREMELLAELGCPFIAAPPVGATDARIDDLEACGARYRAILELGEQTGVTPLMELWGWSPTLGRLADAAAIAISAKHPNAGLLLDAYHLYKGDGSFVGLKQINGAALPLFHLNDYPAEPSRESITDKDRIYPGDGICPLGEIIRTLCAAGFQGAFSLELFNQNYWKTQTPLEVAQIGLEKMKTVVNDSLVSCQSVSGVLSGVVNSFGIRRV